MIFARRSTGAPSLSWVSSSGMTTFGGSIFFMSSVLGGGALSSSGANFSASTNGRVSIEAVGLMLSLHEVSSLPEGLVARTVYVAWSSGREFNTSSVSTFVRMSYLVVNRLLSRSGCPFFNHSNYKDEKNMVKFTENTDWIYARIRLQLTNRTEDETIESNSVTRYSDTDMAIHLSWLRCMSWT